MMWKALLLLSVLTGIVKVAAGNVCEGVDSGTRCTSCTTLAVCSNGASLVAANCQTDTVCGEDTDGSASCYSLATATTTSGDPDLTACQCSGPYPKFMPDAFDPSKYLLCLSDTNTLSLSCPAGQIFSDQDNLCQNPPPTTTPRPIECTQQGIFPVLDACTSYYACYPNPEGGFMPSDIIPCSPQGNIFSPIEKTCVNPSVTLPPKPTSCEADSVVVPDEIECNAFYVCAATQVIGEAICCPPDQVFNPATMICETSADGVSCGSDDPCITKLIPENYTPKCG